MCSFKAIEQSLKIMLKLLDIEKTLHLDSLGLSDYGTIKNFKWF